MPTDQPIRPEDIKPGDWIRYRLTFGAIERLAVVDEVSMSGRVVFTGNPISMVPLSDVLEVRRG